jgi:cytochrome P450
VPDSLRKPDLHGVFSRDRISGLTTDDILSATMVMFTAGGMATGAVIANSTLTLLHEPERIPLLMADPAQAAEELLRMEETSKSGAD